MSSIPVACICLAMVIITLFFIYIVIVYGGVGLGSVFILFSGAILATVNYGIVKRKTKKAFRIVVAVFAEIVLVITLYHYVNGRDYRRSCEIISMLPRRWDDQQVQEIFFLQTSNNSNLTTRAACAIESAALHHPNWTVTLYNISAIVEDDVLRTLRELPNFRLETIDLSVLYQETPLWSWYQSREFARSVFAANKLSNPTRYLLLYQKGGIYLDTDAIVLRSMADLRNSLGLEHRFSVNNAVLVFDKQHSLIKTVIERFEQSYTSTNWGTEGPKLFTKLLPEVCSNSTFWSMASYDYMMHPERCPGFTVLPSYAFYPLWFFPVPFYNIFRTEVDVKSYLSCSYTLHLWNSLSSDYHSNVESTQLVDVLAKENCPIVYEKVIRKRQVGI